MQRHKTFNTGLPWLVLFHFLYLVGGGDSSKTRNISISNVHCIIIAARRGRMQIQKLYMFETAPSGQLDLFIEPPGVGRAILLTKKTSRKIRNGLRISIRAPSFAPFAYKSTHSNLGLRSLKIEFCMELYNYFWMGLVREVSHASFASERRLFAGS